MTEADLRGLGYSEKTIAIVRLLTRLPGGTDLDWIRDLAASGNRGAMRVTLADNTHNSAPGRVAQLPAEARSIARRYERSMRILRAALAESWRRAARRPDPQRARTTCRRRKIGYCAHGRRPTNGPKPTHADVAEPVDATDLKSGI